MLQRLRLQNPVLSKDVLTRMRGAKAFIVQGIYVGIIAIMMGVAYLDWWSRHRFGASPVNISSDLGRMLYQLVFQTQAALVCLITPALTAGAITIEHEQQTYELLACSRLAPRTIIMGKLLSGWLFIVMLLTCSLPMAALCFLFGGVSAGEIFWSYIVLCVFAFFYGSIGVFFSSLVRRSTLAVVLTFASVFVCAMASLLVQLLLSMSSPWGNIGVFNPFIFINSSAETLKIFSLTIPGWLPVIAVLPLCSLLLLNWAISRLPNFVVNRALVMRMLLALLLPAFTLLGLGDNTASGHYSRGGNTVLAIGIIGAIALFGLTALFATGSAAEAKPRALLAWLLSGLDPRKIFSNKFCGGWAYLILLAALFSLCFIPASFSAGTAAATAQLQQAAAMRSHLPTPPAPALYAFGVKQALPLFLLIAAVLMYYSSLGALGAAFKSRAMGIVLIVVLIFLTHLVPGIFWIQYGNHNYLNGPDESSPVAYPLYLAPYIGIAAICEPSVENSLPWNMRTGAATPPPVFSGPTGRSTVMANPPAPIIPKPNAPPIWQVTAVIYLVLALFTLGISELIYQARREHPAQAAVVPEQSLQAGG
jgi:ABC-type transport system involved in multi-copper enzyme maturation permease subunit